MYNLNQLKEDMKSDIYDKVWDEYGYGTANEVIDVVTLPLFMKDAQYSFEDGLNNALEQHDLLFYDDNWQHGENSFTHFIDIAMENRGMEPMSPYDFQDLDEHDKSGLILDAKRLELREACEQNQDNFVRICIADYLQDKGYKEAKVELIEAMTREKTNYDEKSMDKVFEQSMAVLGLNEKTCGIKNKENRNIVKE